MARMPMEDLWFYIVHEKHCPVSKQAKLKINPKIFKNTQNSPPFIGLRPFKSKVSTLPSTFSHLFTRQTIQPADADKTKKQSDCAVMISPRCCFLWFFAALQ